MDKTWLCSAYLATTRGDIRIEWTPLGVARIRLPDAENPTATGVMAPDALPEPIAAVARTLVRYLAGETVRFDDVALDRTGLSAFHIDVYEAARHLRYGETVTYAMLAAQAGHAGRQREVGQALGRNPWPIIVPCHRIVGADGRLVGFSAPGGLATKRQLLAMERASPPIADVRQASFSF